MTLKTLAYEEVDTEPVFQFTVLEVSLTVSLQYWNPVTGWQDDPPSFNLGLSGGVRVAVTNNMGASLYIRAEAAIRRPDGSYTSLVGERILLAPGNTGYWEFTFTADQTGTWQHNLGVYSGTHPDYMSLTVSQGWTDAAYTAVAAAGTITLHGFWNPSTGTWQATPPALYVGETLQLRGHARNDSGAQMRARMDAIVTDPSGNATTLSGAETTMAAGEQGTWTFSIDLDEAGIWTVVLVLYGELV